MQQVKASVAKAAHTPKDEATKLAGPTPSHELVFLPEPNWYEGCLTEAGIGALIGGTLGLVPLPLQNFVRFPGGELVKLAFSAEPKFPAIQSLQAQTYPTICCLGHIGLELGRPTLAGMTSKIARDIGQQEVEDPFDITRRLGAHIRYSIFLILQKAQANQLAISWDFSVMREADVSSSSAAANIPHGGVISKYQFGLRGTLGRVTCHS